MAAPNLLGTTTVTGKTTVQLVTTAATAIVTNSANSGKVLKVNLLFISNIDSNNDCNITVEIFRSSVSYYLIRSSVIPATSSMDLLTKTLYLEEGDALRLTASANNLLHSVCSYEELS